MKVSVCILSTNGNINVPYCVKRPCNKLLVFFLCNQHWINSDKAQHLLNECNKTFHMNKHSVNVKVFAWVRPNANSSNPHYIYIENSRSGGLLRVAFKPG